MILKYVLKFKKDNKLWFDVIYLYFVVLNKIRLNGEFLYLYIILEIKVIYNECIVVWYNEKVLLNRILWC